MQASWQGIRHISVTEILAELVSAKPGGVFAKFGGWAPTYAEIDARAKELPVSCTRWARFRETGSPRWRRIDTNYSNSSSVSPRWAASRFRSIPT